MRRTFIMMLIVALLSLSGWAQPDPRTPQPDAPGTRGDARNPGVAQYLGLLTRQPTTVMEATPQGLFLLRNGILARYDGRSAKPAKQIELYDALPALPAENATDEVLVAYILALAKRLLPVTIVPHNTDLVIANVEQVWCIDALTLTVKARVPLPEQPPGGAGLAAMPMRMYQGAPSLEVNDQTAYLVRGNQLTAVDLAGAKVLFDGLLPVAMTPNIEALMRRFRPNPPINPGGAGPAGGNQPNPGPGQNQPAGELTTVVGTLHRVDLEGGFWSIEMNNGTKYVLSGDKLRNLLGNTNMEGARVRLTGRVGNHAGVAQYGNGYFTIAEFEVLERPK